MPFGLTNAPATWQRIIDTILRPELEPNVFVYLDDIIIINNNFEDHSKLLSIIFDRLNNSGLKVSVGKCRFCVPELKYLGYLVDAQGLRPDPEKVEAIVNFYSNTMTSNLYIGRARIMLFQTFSLGPYPFLSVLLKLKTSRSGPLINDIWAW